MAACLAGADVAAEVAIPPIGHEGPAGEIELELERPEAAPPADWSASLASMRGSHSLCGQLAQYERTDVLSIELASREMLRDSVISGPGCFVVFRPWRALALVILCELCVLVCQQYT